MVRSGAVRAASRATATDWRSLLRHWAPPVRQRQFWVVQFLVLLIAAGHSLLEADHLFDLGHASFIPVSMYLLPVTYAGLVFGVRGAGPTALWCALLTLPNAVEWHEGSEVLGELWQAALVVVVGFLVGLRVDGERRASREAESRARERRASEDKYRTVFDAAGDGIVLLDEEGTIQEANAAAAELLGRAPRELRGRPFAEAAPRELTAFSSHARAPTVIGPIDKLGAGRRWIAPVQTRLTDAGGRSLRLILLRDVSLQVERQQLLEGFARRELTAREKERHRIARELHDGPLQSVVLLWRRLDEIEFTDGEVKGALADARATAEEIAADLRRFSRDLRPSVLDDLGLGAALRAEVAGFQARSGISARYEARGGENALDEEEQLAFLRVCQEALHNVERHAKASRVVVRLSASPSRCELTVEDNGIGIRNIAEPADLVRQGRLGVVGMQERARLIGGTCTVRPGKTGTTVCLRVGRPPQPARGRHS